MYTHLINCENGICSQIYRCFIASYTDIHNMLCNSVTKQRLLQQRASYEHFIYATTFL